MSAYSLDTDIITKLLKKHPGNQRIVERFREEIRRNSLFVICPVVFYEIRRELVFKRAVAQLPAFERLVEAMTWKEFSPRIWDRASNLWSALRAGGRSHHDADVLIAAHALEYGAVIVTGTRSTFRAPAPRWKTGLRSRLSKKGKVWARRGIGASGKSSNMGTEQLASWKLGCGQSKGKG